MIYNKDFTYQHQEWKCRSLSVYTSVIIVKLYRSRIEFLLFIRLSDLPEQSYSRVIINIFFLSNDKWFPPATTDIFVNL